MQTKPTRVIIPDNAFCVCGSGKQFSDCCKKKNHVYEVFTIDQSGKHITYDQTEIITAVDSLNNFISSRIETVDTRLSREEALRKLKKLLEKLDQALAPMQHASSCRAGCGHCCHLLIMTSQLEYELLRDYMNQHYTAEQIEVFIEKINKNKVLLSDIVVRRDGKFSEENRRAYAVADIPCAFLDDNQRCMVYEARPFICRKYLVFNEPEICKDSSQNTTQYYAGYHSTVKDVIIKLNQLTYGKDYLYKHLLSWFV